MVANPVSIFRSGIQRIAGYGGGSDLALTAARMLAATHPGDRGVPNFLDRKAELTAADWIDMVGSMGARWDRLDLGSPNPFLDPPETEYLPPGALEQLRRLIADAVLPNGGARTIAPELSDQIFDFAWQKNFAPSIDERIGKFIASLVVPKFGDKIYCAYDWTSVIALEFARLGFDVSLDLQQQQLAALCSCLMWAEGLQLVVRVGDPLALARRDIDENFPNRRGFDVSIVIPPINQRLDPESLDALETGLPPSANSEAAGVALALARGKSTAVCLIAPSFLFRSSKADQAFKEAALRKYALDATVALPRGAFTKTAIGAALLVFKPAVALNNRRTSEPAVFMVDGREAWSRSTTGSSGLEPISDLILHHRISTISTSVLFDDLVTNDFNLSPERYVLDPNAVRLRDLEGSAPIVQLDDIAEIYRPQAYPQSKNATEGSGQALAEVGVTDIGEAGLVRRASKIIAVDPDASLHTRKARLEAGDVLLVIKGSVGRVGFVRDVPPEMTWLASQSFVIVRLRPHGPLTDPRVLFRFLTSSLGQASISSLRTGTAVPVLQMAAVRRLSVLLPEPQQQRLIGDEVERLFAMQEQIERLRSDLFRTESEMWPETEPHGVSSSSGRDSPARGQPRSQESAATQDGGKHSSANAAGRRNALT